MLLPQPVISLVCVERERASDTHSGVGTYHSSSFSPSSSSSSSSSFAHPPPAAASATVEPSLPAFSSLWSRRLGGGNPPAGERSGHTSGWTPSNPPVERSSRAREFRGTHGELRSTKVSEATCVCVGGVWIVARCCEAHLERGIRTVCASGCAHRADGLLFVLVADDAVASDRVQSQVEMLFILFNFPPE